MPARRKIKGASRLRGRLAGFFLRRPGSTGQEITIDGASGIVTVDS